ncbi:uncharacterized protein DUF2851 [Algoriphagus boseongensis]|uniref:Uncharacterized protein DUF2851 n=1 Tax=Algoriphagus boseongensis TaxID=1442587 RepID=A0A4R6T7Y9_9BACT|nr:DUF2851 family protein [Algoriphagus boseongensis]TDQ17365.1 uncharacterized protein DUF2851 [Algoriphagus boseongensis]
MNFREDFLQLVWKYQYFDRKGLKTTNGNSLQILQVGFHNQGEGPDFRDASLILDGITLHGHVEVHRFASEWKQHAHGGDPAYNSVILHVVWENDKEVYRNDGTVMPTLELKGKIFLEIWRNYENLLDFKSTLPCAHALRQVPQIIRFSALEKALVERLQEKSNAILQILDLTKGDWEETAYRWLMTCFGFKTNAIPMAELAKTIPYKVLQKHRTQVTALEAILLGQAGLLPENSEEPYVQHLIREHDFYQKKFSWNSSLTRPQWSFMGVRPTNFPTLRIAQLAAIFSKAPNLLKSVLEESRDFTSFKKLLQVKPSDYWQHHYNFGNPSSRIASRGISGTTLELLIINFVTPLWFAYGRYFEQSEWQERCFDLLQTIPGENNFIIRKFEEKEWKAENAFDSQGMIGLFRGYCQAQKCLSCKIGQSLLKGQSK